MEMEQNKSFEENEYELLKEKYSFRTSGNVLYYLKPALVEEIMDGSFINSVNKIGLPKEDDVRYHYIMLLNNEEKIKNLSEFIEKYLIDFQGNKVTFDEFIKKGATTDDVHALIKRICGISGH